MLILSTLVGFLTFLSQSIDFRYLKLTSRNQRLKACTWEVEGGVVVGRDDDVGRGLGGRERRGDGHEGRGRGGRR